MFSCRIFEIFKNTLFDVCERLLLKPVLLPGLTFLITYTTGSNWYLCFSFCIIIYSFVCWFSFQYYRHCHNQKQPFGGAFMKLFLWSCRSTEFNFIKNEISAKMFSCEFCELSHNTFFKELFGRLLLNKHSLCLVSNQDLSSFQKRCHTYSATDLGGRARGTRTP